MSYPNIYQSFSNCPTIITYKKTDIKVQCITTKCGFYEELKFGEWYDVTESDDYYIIEDNSRIGLSHFSHLYKKAYPKSLFRTKDERRDTRLKNLI